MPAHRCSHASICVVTAMLSVGSSASLAAAIAAVSATPVNPIGSPRTVRISCARSNDGLTAPDSIRVTVVGATSTIAAS